MKEEHVITLTGNPTVDLAILEREKLRIRRKMLEEDYKKMNEAFEKYKKQIEAQ